MALVESSELARCRLEVRRTHFAPMRVQVIDVLIGRGLLLLDPFMSAHVAHAMEMGAVFDRNGGSANIADEYAGLQDLNFFSGCDGSVDLPAGDYGSCGHDSFDHGMFAHDQGAGGTDFSLNLPIYADGRVKSKDALEVDALPEEGKVLAVAGLIVLFTESPHQRRTLLSHRCTASCPCLVLAWKTKGRQ
jgi:hypothetical protein